MAIKSREQTIEECASATRLHIAALEELTRQLPILGDSAPTFETLHDVLEGLEITASKLERLKELGERTMLPREELAELAVLMTRQLRPELNPRAAQDEARLQELQAVEPGSWDENPVYLRADWKAEVGNGDTQLGYWDWVEHKLDALGSTAEELSYSTDPDNV